MCNHMQVQMKFSQLFCSQALFQQNKCRCADMQKPTVNLIRLIVLSVHIFTCTYSSKMTSDQDVDIEKTRIHANTRDKLKKCDWIGLYPKSKSGHRSHFDRYEWSHVCLNTRLLQKGEVLVCSPMLFPINPLLSGATGRHGGT